MKILKILFLLGLTIIFSCDKSKDSWVTTKSENTIQSYRKFIHDFPKSAFTDSAKFYLKRLESYNEASNQNTIESYMDFINNYGYRSNSLLDSAKLKIESIYYKESKTINTYNGYSSFIELNPESIFVDSINAQINALMLLRHPKLQTAETANIIINSNIPGEDNEEINKSINKRVSQALTASGFIIGKANGNSDITVKIRLTGEALSKIYQGRNKLYSGAIIEGSIRLLILNNVIANYPFKLTENPRKVLLLHQSDQYKKPEDAPFWMLDWKQSLEIQLLKLVIEFMGYPSFIGLLEQKNYSFPTSDPRDSYYTNICNLSNLSLNEKKGIAQSLRYILEHKENCDWNFVVFLLGELKDERAVKPIMESENWDSDWHSDRDTIEEKIAQKAIEKITKKKFKTFDDLKLWWTKQSNN